MTERHRKTNSPSGIRRDDVGLWFFRLSRRRREKFNYTPSRQRNEGPFVTDAQCIGVHDASKNRVVLVETESGVLAGHRFRKPGEDRDRIHNNSVVEHLTKTIRNLEANVDAGTPSCRVYTSHDNEWRSAKIVDLDDRFVISDIAMQIAEADPTTFHIEIEISFTPDSRVVVSYWPRGATRTYSLENCIDDVLYHLGTLDFIPKLTVLGTVVIDVEPDSLDLDDARASTTELCGNLLDDPTEADDGYEDALLLIQQLLMQPLDDNRVSWLTRTYRPDFARMVGLRQGEPVVGILAAEQLVQVASSGMATDPEVDNVDAFAAALTHYLCAHAAAHARTGPAVISRVCNLMTEWTTRESVRPYQTRLAVDATRLSPEAMDRLDALVIRAPWLESLVINRPRGREVRIELSDDDLVVTLALIRPRTTYVRAGHNVRKGGTPIFHERFATLAADALTQRYKLSASVAESAEEHPWLIDYLARTCERLFFLPTEARRALQVLAPLISAAEAVEKYCAEAESKMAVLSDIVTLVDHPPSYPPRLVLVNTNAMSRIAVECGGVPAELAEFAPDVDLATKYVSTTLLPLEWKTAPPEVELRTSTQRQHVDVPIRGSMSTGTQADTEWIDPALFRGRREQLVRLQSVMRMDRTLRPPTAIFGPRRAGKTTLAVHSCRLGVKGEYLAGFVVIDMYNDVDGTRPDGYSKRFSALLGARLTEEVGVEFSLTSDDPIDALVELDAALAGALPIGIVLDEFDTLLSAEPDSEFRRLATRLGGRRWTNLVVIATVQRFHRSASDLHTWEFVECREDLSWRDALTYFCPPILDCEIGARGAFSLTAPIMLPSLLRSVVERVGHRPYFWGRVRNQIENHFVAEGGYAVVAADRAHEIIDAIVTADPFLALPLQDTTGIPLAECRRRDLFSDGERRILASFASAARRGIPLTSAQEIGGPEAAQELLDRAYVKMEGQQIAIAVPLFAEFLAVHANEFALFAAAGAGTS
ncbi:hypothetical protein EV580_3408 [Mycobacterium sp. BK086]|uniref:hypothetical protein n=1 Tax=Mycobacterium sp. BK086 TaxID=2512165 RepID=UPI00105F9B2A|nr:hypothetical protein [Mycobacterium sp. BK086]TDO11689.1 hypothetical protein EV580_3408 [Mycobacterium sp. BK086]